MPTIGSRLKHAWNAFTDSDSALNLDSGAGVVTTTLTYRRGE